MADERWLAEPDAQLLFARCHEAMVGASSVEDGLALAAPELEPLFPRIMVTVLEQAAEGVEGEDEQRFVRGVCSAFVWGLLLGRELERHVALVAGDG